MFHLPDLPNAGYATQRQRALTDAIMFFMREVERDRLRLLNIVLEGRETWRRIAGSVFNGFRVDTKLLDTMYDYFTLQACPPIVQRQLLDHAQNPLKWREIVKGAMSDLELQREALRLQQKWAP